MTKPTVGVLYSPGTNSHVETMYAFDRAGADARLVFMSDLRRGTDRLDGFDIVCIPGGFAYGDHLGGGTLTGLSLREALADQVEAIRAKPLLAICNGFQIGLRAGLFGAGLTLTVNANGTFQNIQRQPHLVDPAAETPWLTGLSDEPIRFPCAHGEGRFVYESTDGWRPALRYPADENPDGSMDDIAGIVSADGTVFGLMDHPERAPDDDRAMQIFVNGVDAVRT